MAVISGVRNTTGRTFADRKPYALPSSWSALRGPASGVLELPHHVHWGPSRRFDMDVRQEAEAAYQTVLAEGSWNDLEVLLNPGVLRNLWNTIALPPRLRTLWETAFPNELSHDRR